MSSSVLSHYKKIPSTVKIGCYSFKVEVGPSWAFQNSSELGHCNLDECAIRLSPTLSPQQLANTFLHEVIHAIHWVYGLEDTSNEERFTNETANGLCALWQDNPQTMDWWKSIVNMESE